MYDGEKQTTSLTLCVKKISNKRDFLGNVNSFSFANRILQRKIFQSQRLHRRRNFFTIVVSMSDDQNRQFFLKTWGK